MDAYSLDLRARICAACDEGVDSITEIAERFEVGRWFVHKLLRQRREQKSIAPRPRGHGLAAALGTADHTRLRRRLKEKPDATLKELCRWLAESDGPGVSVSTMCKTLQRLHLPRKKRRCTPANAIRPESGRCGVITANAWRPSTRLGWSSSTRAASTPP
jgi:transposase